jgi:hypothetical protein
MVDFLIIDLDERTQPAEVRLRDEMEYGDIVITQAHFSIAGAHIERLRSNKKAKSWHLTTEEMDTLCAAWTEYQARKVQHTVEIAERRGRTIVEATALAKSAQFDLETLNIQINPPGPEEDDIWHITVPQFAYNDYCGTLDLIEHVQKALKMIRKEVEGAEKWRSTSGICSGNWPEIITSYRRIFPLEPESKITIE